MVGVDAAPLKKRVHALRGDENPDGHQALYPEKCPPHRSARVWGLLHHSHVISIRGESYRLKNKRRGRTLSGKIINAKEKS